MIKKLLPLLLLILVGCIPSHIPLSTPPKYYEYIDEDTQEITTYSITTNGKRLVLYSGTDITYDEDGKVLSKQTYKDGKPDGEWIETSAIISISDGIVVKDFKKIFTTIYEDGIEIEVTEVRISPNKIETTTSSRIGSEDNWKMTFSEEIIE